MRAARENMENTMRMQVSPRSCLSCLAGVLIGVQAGLVCAQDVVTPPVADTTADAAADKPAQPATKPAKAPTTRKAAKPTAGGDEAKPAQPLRLTRNVRLDPKSPLGQAVEEIRREYDRGAMRTESSYFRDAPCTDLTTDNLFILLDRKLGASNVADGYIKWQLLSSLPKSLAAQYKPMVIAALNKAPVPEMMAGVITDDAQRQQMERKAARFNEEQAKAAMEQLDSERGRIHTLNMPILAYRAALAELLDESYDGVMAAFGDAYHRAQAGAEYASAVERGVQLANGWLKTDPPANMLQRFAGALAEMRDMKLNDVVAQFDPNEKRGGFDLRRDQRGLDSGGRIRALEIELERRLGTAEDNRQNNPTNGRQRGH